MKQSLAKLNDIVETPSGKRGQVVGIDLNGRTATVLVNFNYSGNGKYCVQVPRQDLKVIIAAAK